MDHITLIVCSYHTPRVLLSMLQSFVAHHPDWLPQRLLVMENSTDEETVALLKTYNIPFQRQPGDSHSVSLDKALYLCQTKYALIVDTDVLFKQRVTPLFQRVVAADCALFGELVQSCGGYQLVDRIAPWLCFVNIGDIHKRGIRFHDQARVEASGSQGFFQMGLLTDPHGGPYYDVGSTFMCDVIAAGLKVVAISEATRKEFVEHYEGMSWQPQSEVLEYRKLATQVLNKYRWAAQEFHDVNIQGAFVNFV
jgi:hypothetical protein